MTSREKRIKILDAEKALNKSALKKIEARMSAIKVSSDEWSELASQRNVLLVDIQVAKKKMYFAVQDKPYLGSEGLSSDDSIDLS